MKLHKIISIFIFTILFSSIVNAQQSKSIVIGKVHNWPTDTIYVQTLPFHSPISNMIKHTLISKDSTFLFEFEKTNKPFVFYIGASKSQIEKNVKKVLFDNFTKEGHLTSYCDKFYTWEVTTHLIEPLEKVVVDLTYNGWNKTKVQFSDENKFKNEFFQKTFLIGSGIGKRLQVEKNNSIELVIENLKKYEKNLLKILEKEKSKLGNTHYNYIKAEIEFGVKIEFIKFLKTYKKKFMDTLFLNKIPKKIIDLIEFDKKQINDATLINETYNKYLESYLNFKINIINKKNIEYNPISYQKFRTAIKILPKSSVYYYLANHLLQKSNNHLYKIFKSNSKFNENALLEELITGIIKHYPNGKLNNSIIKKFQL